MVFVQKASYYIKYGKLIIRDISIINQVGQKIEHLAEFYAGLKLNPNIDVIFNVYG